MNDYLILVWELNGIWDLGMGGNGIWDWDGIMTNGMGWDGYGMGFDTNGNWDSPIPISMGGKYIYIHYFLFHQHLSLQTIDSYHQIHQNLTDSCHQSLLPFHINDKWHEPI